MLARMRLIILVGLGIVSFAVAFSISFWLRPRGTEGAVAQQSRPPHAQQPMQSLSRWGLESGTEDSRRQELEKLIKEVRTRVAECQQRQVQLDTRERRIRMAAETLGKQAKELEKLRIEIVAPLARLKEIQEGIRRTRIAIFNEETGNLKKIAKIYQTKDPVAAAETIEAMCKNDQKGDAAKILYFMSERSAGKILSAISDRNLVADLCNHMKRITSEG